MLDLLNTIVQWIVTGINNILSFIAAIPTYAGYLLGFAQYLPNSLVTVFIVCLSIFIAIKIKRLVF